MALCRICKERMMKKNLNRHVRLMHSDADLVDSFVCPLCRKEYQTEGNYNTHFKAIHAKDMKMRPKPMRYMPPKIVQKKNFHRRAAAAPKAIPKKNTRRQAAATATQRNMRSASASAEEPSAIIENPVDYQDAIVVQEPEHMQTVEILLDTENQAEEQNNFVVDVDPLLFL